MLFIANNYRPKNVKLPYPIARFTNKTYNVLYVNGLSLHTKNAVIFTEWQRFLFHIIYNVKTKINMT